MATVSERPDGGARSPLAGLVRPPEVRSTAPERSSTALELFFDLAFVVAFSAIAVRFGDDMSPFGWLDFAACFVALWWAWAAFTLYANRFDTDDVVFRLAKLAAMLAVVVCSVVLPGRGGVPTSFVLGYLATQLLLVGLYLRTYRHVEEARGLSTLYLGGLGAGAACWAASLLLDPSDRPWLALAGVAVSLLTPVVGFKRGRSVPLHLEHLPERFGLLVILVLGETIISVGKGLTEVRWTVSATTVAVAGFVLAAALWWLYFDLGAKVAKSGLTDLEEAEASDESDEADAARFDGYVYGHVPATLGLVAVGVGVDHAITETSKGALTLGTLLALCGGAALFIAALATIQAATTGVAGTGWPWPAGGALLLVGVLLLGLVASPVVVALLTAAVAVATVVAGGLKDARGEIDTEDTDVM